MPKSLSQLYGGGAVSLIDFIVVRKYPLYFQEFGTNTPAKLRSPQSAERICEETPDAHLRPAFKLKILDTLDKQTQAMLTVYGQGIDAHDEIKEGERMCAVNLVQAHSKATDVPQLALATIKASRLSRLKEKHPQHVAEPVSVTELHSCDVVQSDIQSFCAIKKIILEKDHVWKVIALVASAELVCIEFQDRNFVKAPDFPAVGKYALLDNLQYASTTVVAHSDLSFTTHELPCRAPDPSQNFVYHTLRFSAKSAFKLTSASSCDETKRLKSLTGDKEFTKELQRKIRHMLHQGQANRVALDWENDAEPLTCPEEKKE